jgi:hypothetical protein
MYSRRSIDLTGQRFGFLTVLSRAGTRRTKSHRIALWRCRCDCGQEVIAWSRRLRAGKHKACGKNGHNYRPNKGGPTSLHRAEYRSWRGMWDRCYGDIPKNIRNYKSRGISVCERWKNFAAFLEDMGKKPTPKHTLDRYPNNDGNYEPTNCRWATPKEQNRNMRQNVFVEYEGERVLLLDVVEKLGLNRYAVYGRIKNGWNLGV